MHRYSTYWVEKCALCDVFSSAEEDNYVFKGVSWGYSTDLNIQLIPFLQTTSCPASSSPSSPPQDRLTRFPWSRSRRMTWTPPALHWTSRRITVPTPPCTCAGTATPVCLCLITAWLWRYSSSAHIKTHPLAHHTHSSSPLRRWIWENTRHRSIAAFHLPFPFMSLFSPLVTVNILYFFHLPEGFLLFSYAFSRILTMYMHERFSRNFSDTNILSLQTWRLPNRSFFSISSSPS